ncbi:hypothetical protein AHAS_Ahas13G0274600 [Arachis hypogaea]
MYNQIEKQRQLMESDVTETLKYLKKQKKLDPKFYWSYQVDNNGMFRHLIWMEGKSCVDFEVFGDVVAFDATYKKNKYKFPSVVFSGVNHHLQTIVFGNAIVADEGEGTYIWLLQRFVEAMNGKRPDAVITDGAKAMKLAIEKVFPDAHHRLCGWHLLRNAIANVSNPKFTQQFRKCMLGDYEIDEFKERWASMVNSFGVKDMEWVETTYGIKDMWATAHMRGKFFAGLRLHRGVRHYIRKLLELPESLILKRWTMKAKEAHIRLEQWGSLIGNGSYESKIAAMNDELEGLPFAACGDLGDFKDVMEWVRNKKAELFAKHEKNRKGSSNSAGHNRRNCRRRDDHNQMESGDGGGPEDDDDWSSQTSEEGIDEMGSTSIFRIASTKNDISIFFYVCIVFLKYFLPFDRVSWNMPLWQLIRSCWAVFKIQYCNLKNGHLSLHIVVQSLKIPMEVQHLLNLQPLLPLQLLWLPPLVPIQSHVPRCPSEFLVSLLCYALLLIRYTHDHKALGLMDMDVVYMEVVVLGSNWIGIGVDLCMAHMAHRVVDMSCVEEEVHNHMVGLVGNYKGVHHIHHLGTLPGMALNYSNLVEVGCHERVHHNYCLSMHCGMVFVCGTVEGVVAERVDQILVAPSISDCFDLNACFCYNFHSLQQHWN